MEGTPQPELEVREDGVAPREDLPSRPSVRTVVLPPSMAPRTNGPRSCSQLAAVAPALDRGTDQHLAPVGVAEEDREQPRV
jgi:hypothetical protein